MKNKPTDEFAATTLVPAQGQVNWRDHLSVHPAAELFPLTSEAELRELGEDIKPPLRGLRLPRSSNGKPLPGPTTRRYDQAS